MNGGRVFGWNVEVPSFPDMPAAAAISPRCWQHSTETGSNYPFYGSLYSNSVPPNAYRLQPGCMPNIGQFCPPTPPPDGCGRFDGGNLYFGHHPVLRLAENIPSNIRSTYQGLQHYTHILDHNKDQIQRPYKLETPISPNDNATSTPISSSKPDNLKAYCSIDKTKAQTSYTNSMTKSDSQTINSSSHEQQYQYPPDIRISSGYHPDKAGMMKNHSRYNTSSLDTSYRAKSLSVHHQENNYNASPLKNVYFSNYESENINTAHSKEFDKPGSESYQKGNATHLYENRHYQSLPNTFSSLAKYDNHTHQQNFSSEMNIVRNNSSENVSIARDQYKVKSSAHHRVKSEKGSHSDCKYQKTKNSTSAQGFRTSDSYCRTVEPFSRTSDSSTRTYDSFHRPTEAFNMTSDTLSRAPDSFSRTSGSFSRTSDSFSRTSDSFSRAPDSFNRAPEFFNRTFDAYIRAPDAYNRSSNSFNTPTSVAEPKMEPKETYFLPTCSSTMATNTSFINSAPDLRPNMGCQNRNFSLVEQRNCSPSSPWQCNDLPPMLTPENARPLVQNPVLNLESQLLGQTPPLDIATTKDQDASSKSIFKASKTNDDVSAEKANSSPVKVGMKYTPETDAHLAVNSKPICLKNIKEEKNVEPTVPPVLHQDSLSIAEGVNNTDVSLSSSRKIAPRSSDIVIPNSEQPSSQSPNINLTKKSEQSPPSKSLTSGHEITREKNSSDDTGARNTNTSKCHSDSFMLSSQANVNCDPENPNQGRDPGASETKAFTDDMNHGLNLLLNTIEKVTLLEKKNQSASSVPEVSKQSNLDKLSKVRGLDLLSAIAGQRLFAEFETIDSCMKKFDSDMDIKSNHPRLSQLELMEEGEVEQSFSFDSECKKRDRLIELQRKYKQKQREFAKLKPHKKLANAYFKNHHHLSSDASSVSCDPNSRKSSNSPVKMDVEGDKVGRKHRLLSSCLNNEVSLMEEKRLTRKAAEILSSLASKDSKSLKHVCNDDDCKEAAIRKAYRRNKKLKRSFEESDKDGEFHSSADITKSNSSKRKSINPKKFIPSKQNKMSNSETIVTKHLRSRILFDTSGSTSDEENHKETNPEDLYDALRKCHSKEPAFGLLSAGSLSYPEPSLLRVEHLVIRQRILALEDGLFYAGCIKEIQGLNKYGIALDGQRGNKLHMFTKNELLTQTITESKPITSDLPEGTRVCAYWSQQYRCLYPGVVGKAPSPSADWSEQRVFVLFDDGDSGQIATKNVRLIPQNIIAVHDSKETSGSPKHMKRRPAVSKRKASRNMNSAQESQKDSDSNGNESKESSCSVNESSCDDTCSNDCPMSPSHSHSADFPFSKKLKTEKRPKRHNKSSKPSDDISRISKRHKKYKERHHRHHHHRHHRHHHHHHHRSKKRKHHKKNSGKDGSPLKQKLTEFSSELNATDNQNTLGELLASPSLTTKLSESSSTATKLSEKPLKTPSSAVEKNLVNPKATTKSLVSSNAVKPKHLAKIAAKRSASPLSTATKLPVKASSATANSSGAVVELSTNLPQLKSNEKC